MKKKEEKEEEKGRKKRVDINSLFIRGLDSSLLRLLLLYFYSLINILNL